MHLKAIFQALCAIYILRTMRLGSEKIRKEMGKCEEQWCKNLNEKKEMKSKH